MGGVLAVERALGSGSVSVSVSVSADADERGAQETKKRSGAPVLNHR